MLVYIYIYIYIYIYDIPTHIHKGEYMLIIIALRED